MAVQAAMAGQPRLLILDTDPLMTAAWAEMLFGTVPPVLMEYPKADLYLLFTPDVPWVDDGTRFFGKGPLRSRFAALAEAMLVRSGVPFRRITGTWAEREAQTRAAIAALTEKSGA
jgi:nicotinamide riboside kinase